MTSRKTTTPMISATEARGKVKNRVAATTAAANALKARIRKPYQDGRV